MSNPKKLVLNQLRYNIGSGITFLHHKAFLPIMEIMCDNEQYKKWIPLIRSMKVFGTYAQSEMGHGSDVQGMETEAKYDPTTKMFTFTTPTITGTKFWPGGLGKSANYAYIVARLKSNWRDYGTHGFVVQIRDLETHAVLPGIEVGDIGTKMAFQKMDNGYLIFKGYKAPKSALLTRFISFTDGGDLTYKTENAQRLMYGGMLGLRADICLVSSYLLVRMAGIAARYSFKRRQFGNDQESEETRVILYQSQQYKIVPALTNAFAILFNFDYIKDLLQRFNKEKEEDEKKSFETLAELHKAVSCIKALVCWKGVKFGEQTKLALGGHGFLNSSGHADIHNDFAIGWVSAEGDGTVLVQQTSRALLKEVQTGKLDCSKLEFLPQNETSVERQLCGFFEMRYKTELQRAFLKGVGLVKKGLDFGSDIWNEHVQQELVNAGVYYGDYLICRNFLRAIEGEDLKCVSTSLGKRSPQLNYLMQAMYRNYAMHLIFDESQSFLRNFTKETLDFYQDQKKEYLNVFRSELHRLAMTSLDIVDGWDIEEQEFASLLARKDDTADEMYSNMIRHFRQNPINQKLVKGFNSTMRPFFMNPRL